VARLILDTSVFIAEEQGRPLRQRPEGEAAVSIITLAELELGVHMATDAVTRARRLTTLARVRETFVGLGIGDQTASAFAALSADLLQRGLSAPVQDTWVAATALAHDAAVCTQDDGFARLDGVHGLEVLRV
jgi:predicted nucleic acid-binding protein